MSLGAFNATPNGSSFIYSLPIQGSGSIMIQTNFDRSDQGVSINLSQDSNPFGTSTNLWSGTLTPSVANTGNIAVDIANGGNLTLTKNTIVPNGGNTNIQIVLSSSMINRLNVAKILRRIQGPAPIFIGNTFTKKDTRDKNAQIKKPRLTSEVLRQLSSSIGGGS